MKPDSLSSTSMFHGLDIIGSGLRAELARSEVVAANLANANDTGTADDPPYARRMVTFQEMLADASGGPVAMGVQLKEVFEDTDTPPRRIFDPGHPQADASGWVLGSNVDMFKELVDLSVIERSYQANISAMRSDRARISSSSTETSRISLP